MNQMLFECWRDDDNTIGVLIEELRNCGEGVMEQRIFTSDADSSQRLGPEVANFENEGGPARERDPPGGESD